MRLSLCLASVNQTPLDWRGNLARLVSVTDRLSADSPDIILFPELSLSGYGCEDAFLWPATIKQAEAALLKFCRSTADIPSLILVGLPVLHKDRLFNCVALLARGRILCLIAKSHLAGDGIHYEPRQFSAWNGPFEAIHYAGQTTQIGQGLLATGSFTLMVEICEDSWVTQRPAAEWAGQIDLLLSPSASHYEPGKATIRRRIARESSRNLGTAFAQVNLLGNEAGRAIYDGHALFAMRGELLLESDRLSFRSYQIHRLEIDLTAVRQEKLHNHARKSARKNPSEPLRLDISIRSRSGSFSAASVATLAPYVEFTRAAALGLFDYLRKSRSNGYVISLSGGADSAACLILVERMFRYALREYTPETLLRRLGRSDLALRLSRLQSSGKATDAVFIRFFMREFCHTVYQRTARSSDTTREAARLLARSLHSQHIEVDVEDMVSLYTEKISTALKRTFNWSKDDLTLQNIQARVRSPLAWMLANATGSLLISTGNRSEAAMGYATMDGDTSGGLSPLGGVSKAFLRRWLLWLEEEGDEFGTIPALGAVNAQAPTAELRPLDAQQTDEADLMPYDLLEDIELACLLLGHSPAAIHARLCENRPEDPSVLAGYVVKFFEFLARSQWKRERLAPGFYLGPLSLDPRSWFRFPVLNGGFSEELAEVKRTIRN
ncbi:MAG: NAD(+) synthase [Spirochaetales bacterium]|nr:NAD(+) synthase [Spirochaetales bacterium]